MIFSAHSVFNGKHFSFTAEAVRENVSMLPMECSEKNFQRNQNAVKKNLNLNRKSML